MTKPTEAELIRTQNDDFRTSLGKAPNLTGKMIQTRAVADLGSKASVLIIQKLVAYDRFNEDNDPFGTHEFGSFLIEIDGTPQMIWWKIDLYDLNYCYGSAAPSDPEQTRRVLTILLPEDY